MAGKCRKSSAEYDKERCFEKRKVRNGGFPSQVPITGHLEVNSRVMEQQMQTSFLCIILCMFAVELQNRIG